MHDEILTPRPAKKALADPTRHAVFAKRATGRFNAIPLRDGLNMTQPAMSRHLAVLQQAGLVTAQKQGRAVCDGGQSGWPG